MTVLLLNQYFVLGGYTSGGAQEIVIDSMNIFTEEAVESIEFIARDL